MIDFFRHTSGTFRREAIVGDTLDFGAPVTIAEQPADKCLQHGDPCTAVTLLAPGVYQLSLRINGEPVLAEIFCFPSYALQHPQLRVDSQQRPRLEESQRLVLRSLVLHGIDANNAREVLLRQHWCVAALVGGPASEGLSLQPYGGVNYCG